MPHEGWLAGRRQGLVLVVGMNDTGRVELTAELLRAANHASAFAVVDELDGASLGVPFVRVDPKQAVWFDGALKRSDDATVVLVEETRDRTTAEAVLARARTALVITSVRGPTVTSAIQRLVDLGLSRDAIDAVLVGVLSTSR